MGKFENVLAAILRGTSDNNIAFAELQYALQQLGFEVRIRVTLRGRNHEKSV